jgi:hypothetical protein
MTLPPKDAEHALRVRYGDPAKYPTDKIIGFRTPSGQVLAIHRQSEHTRIWFQPPEPPQISGVKRLDEPKNANSNLNGPLSPLKNPDTQRIEVSDINALQHFLEWYDDESRLGRNPPDLLADIDFRAAFDRFQSLISRFDRPFTRFDEGVMAAWESYKPRVRDLALKRLQADIWTPDQIGTGEIAAKVIDAIEIQATHGDLTNNMVFWQNRYGHANRDHRALLDAVATGRGLTVIERLLFDLYKEVRPESDIFEELKEATGAKYPLMAYLFFLKDMDRFMPIQPTGFDRVFAEIGSDFRTLKNCSWSNYSDFNGIIGALRQPIARLAGLPTVRLIDAHSLLWVFSTLLKMEARR